MVMQGLDAFPANPRLQMARASTLHAWGRHQDAADAFLSLNAPDALGAPSFVRQMGWSLFHSGRMDEAEGCMRRITEIAPDDWKAHSDLAVVMHARGRLEDALQRYKRSLELGPEQSETLILLATCELDRGEGPAAEGHLRRAIELDDNRPEAWDKLGVALGRQERHDEALVALRHAVELESASDENIDSFVNLAVSLEEQGKTEDALSVYEEWLPRRPNTRGHHHYAHALLMTGRMQVGWEQYEFRWLHPPLLETRPQLCVPAWKGQDLRGKVILLQAEQGAGDTFHAVRYASLVKARGATVLLRVPRALARIARGFDGVDEVISTDDALPPIDFHAHLWSLPSVFGTDLESIPARVPYVHADPGRLHQWSERIGSGSELKVGLVWAGDPRHVHDLRRSISLDTLAPLVNVQGIRFYSLQKRAGAAEALDPAQQLDIVDLGPELIDYADTASAISHLDLVIAVDTSVAHLAGALGKPVWVMLPTPSDWRWLQDRTDSPWYPTMRLFRQRVPTDWSGVVAEVRSRLEQQVLDRSRDRRAPAVATAPATVTSSDPIPRRDFSRVPGLSAATEARWGLLQYLPDQPRVGQSIEQLGEYLQPHLELLARMIKPGSTIIEAGAGIGADTLFLASAVGQQGRIYAFETDVVKRRILKQNLSANRIASATIMKSRLAATFRKAGDGSTGVSLGETTECGGIRSVDTVDGLRLERLDWLTIFEDFNALDILAGAQDSLRQLRPNVIIGSADVAAAVGAGEYLQTFAYRRWQIRTPIFNPGNFNRRDESTFSVGAAWGVLAIPEEVEVDLTPYGCVELD